MNKDLRRRTARMKKGLPDHNGSGKEVIHNEYTSGEKHTLHRIMRQQ